MIAQTGDFAVLLIVYFSRNLSRIPYGTIAVYIAVYIAVSKTGIYCGCVLELF